MKKFLAIFLTALLLLAPMTIFAVGATSNKDVNEEKITDELKEVMADKKNNEYIPIYIWLYDLGDEVVYSRLSNKLGKSLNQDNEGYYIEENVKNKIDKFNKKQKEKKNNNQKFDASVFREEAEIGEILTNEEIENCIDDGKTYEQIIELSERYQYLSDFRHSRADINASVNELFEKSINRAKCKNVYIDSALPFVRMECKKSYIIALSKMQSVMEIGLYGKSIFSSDMESSVEAEIASYDTSDNSINHMNRFFNMNYTGRGIRIGVIETKNAYDATNPHLQDKNIIIVEGETTNGETSDSEHPTAIMSFIGGKNVSGYSGVAPDASIYFAGGADNVETIMDYMYLLVVENNVSIINMSFDNRVVTSYSELDKYIDCFIEEYRVTILVASGNNTDGNLSSPANAYNAITVGNVSNDIEYGRFLINSSSSGYEEASANYTNKPDIVAPGTSITMYKLSNGILRLTSYGTGTSASVAIVSGAVALMCESNTDLIGKPDAIKAILVNSASDIISTIDNEIVTSVSVLSNSNVVAQSLVREKSGCGMLNIEGAISMSMSNLLYRYCVPANSTTSEASFYVDDFFIQANKSIEVSMVFGKSYHTIPNSYSNVKTNFDIEVYNSVGERIVRTTSGLNNVETLKIVFPTTDYYRFRIKCNKLSEDTDPCGWHDNINISFLLSCGCDLPSANISNCVNEGHDIVCDNCGLLCQETHMHATETQYYSDVTIKYDVYYKIRQFNYDVNDIICFFDPYPQLTPTNSANRAIYIQDMSYTEFQLYKRWDLLNFEIVIFSPTNEVVANFYSTLYVNIYYSTRECEFDTTV